MSSENVSMKQPIRRLELPISKFNDVAIPHHLDRLRRHKINLKKYERQRDWHNVKKEQINALTLVKLLEQLMYEMDTLRSQVEDNDIEKFDKLTAKSRELTQKAIQEYLEMKFAPPPKPPVEEYESEELNPQDDDKLLLQLEKEQEDLKKEEMCLQAWLSLQNELQQLHQIFVDFSKIIHDQREHVDNIENNVTETEVNVTEGNKCLEKASKLKIAAYPIAGAFLGTCIGGPVGLIAGFKLGGLTALGCGILGFTGASIIKKKHLENLKRSPEMELRPSNKYPSLQELHSKDTKKHL